MKKIKLLVIFLFLMLFIPNIKAEETNEIRLYLFHQSTCPHCREEREFLETIKDKYDNLDIVEYEVDTNEMNYNFYRKVKDKTGITDNGVPLTIIGTYYNVGFGDGTGELLTSHIDTFEKDYNKYMDVVSKVKNEEDYTFKADRAKGVILVNGKNILDGDSNTKRHIPIIGDIDMKTVSLPLVSIVIGFVDGFNPCAMWVLLFLITMLFNMKDKKKMWILGITFLVTSALVYLLIMLAWLNVAVSFTGNNIIRMLIALVALIGGFINLRSYVRSKNKDDGCEVVDEKKRKKTIEKIKQITHEKSFLLAMVGIITLAVSVNLIELACSAGLPLIFTQILALNDLNAFQYGFYMFLYILFFLIDDIVIFVIAMLTLNIKGISSKYGKYSHLIGGIIMVLIGILMIFKPEWLMFNFK